MVMLIRAFSDLNIVSAQIPKHLHLFIETSDGTLWLAQFADPQKLYYSTDKGDNWTLKTTREDSITMFYYDQTNERVYGVDGTKGDVNSSHQFYIDTSNKNITEGDLAGSKDEMIDIIWDGTRAFAMKLFRGGGGAGVVWFYAREFNFVWTDSVSTGHIFDAKNFDTSPGVVIGGWDYFLYWHEDLNLVRLYKYQINADVWTVLATSSANTRTTPSKSQQGIAYDGSDVLYFVLQDTSDNKFYLYTYVISTDILTKLGEYNVSLMLDRNTASGVLEKGIHLTDDFVYQIHNQRQQLYKILEPQAGDTLLAITDSFLIDESGNMYEFLDLHQYVYEFNVNYGYMKIPTAFMTVIDLIKISEGMFIRIEDTFTTDGSTSTEVIFEGYVEPFVEQRFQEVMLRSPATELLQIKPEGDYSGRTDQIIVSLLEDYAKYVLQGTLSAGTSLGQIHFDGDLSLFQILNDFALIDKFIWYLTPTGLLNYNNGTVDSTINISETDPMSRVRKHKGPRAYNEIKIKGTIAGGDQVQGDVAKDLQDQQENGFKPYSRTISSLNTNALCTTAETNILSRWGTQATLVDFLHRDTTVGVIQSGETITFQNDKTDPNVPSGQFLIKNIRYDAKNQVSVYTISDQVL